MPSNEHCSFEPGWNSISVRQVPIELLQTFALVSEVRSQVRAARRLGVSQPTISTHIKRLHDILGVDVFDKSIPGISLTPVGELILAKAKKLLELHDEIFSICARRNEQHTIRIGIHRGQSETILFPALERWRGKHQNSRFLVVSDTSENLLSALHLLELDIVLAATVSDPPLPSKHIWRLELVWAAAREFQIPEGSPVPLIAYSGNSVLTQTARTALEHTNCQFDIVFASGDAASLSKAVEAGLGVAAMPSQFLTASSTVYRDDRLPTLPDLVIGLYRRPMQDASLIDELADLIAEAVHLPESSPRTVAA